MRRAIIVGLVGPSGSGKTTLTQYLKKKGFMAVTLSTFLREILEKKGETITKKSLQDLGNKLRKRYGAGVLARKALMEIKKKGRKRTVIDGVRNLEEIKVLKAEDNFYLVGINARPDIRYQRCRKQRKLKNYQEFVRLEIRDTAGGISGKGLQVQPCYLNADFFIDNNTSVKSFYKEVDKLLKKIL